MKHITITAMPNKSTIEWKYESHTFYLIISGNNVNLFPIEPKIEPISYDSMYDFLEEWSNVSKA